MEIRQLQYFIAVVDHGNISKAAQHLGITQQALSKSIKTLGRATGCPPVHPGSPRHGLNGLWPGLL